jgi:glutamate/tyrosine decarboxylase-like PLP-dependent enzyme
MSESLNYSNAETDGPSLDPQSWDDMRALARSMVDDMIDYLQTVGERPVWTAPPPSAIDGVGGAVPSSPSTPEGVYADFKRDVLPYTKGNISPRHFSWVEGNGTVMGMMADMLAAGMNPNVTIGDHMAMYVDQAVIEWCRQIMGMPDTASGMLVSGGSLANITALTVARNNLLDGRIRTNGMVQAGVQLVVYCSSETHNCVNKAVEVLGIGSDYLRRIPVDSDFRIDIQALKEQIAEDRIAGFYPFCIIGNAGTVNTGAIDPLDELLHIARDEDMWFHVDGAFGSVAKITDEFAPALKAIEEADSLAFDLHKWFYVNYEVGCVLIRDRDIHRNAFKLNANYLLSHDRGLAAGPETLSNYGLELSRGFKALKVWMSLKEHGVDRYKEVVTRNIRQARYLGQMVDIDPQFELMTPVTLNIVCFRYLFETGDPNTDNKLNRELLMRLHESGVATPSYTILDGKYCIRVNITNHRTQKADLDIMMDWLRKEGEALSKVS